MNWLSNFVRPKIRALVRKKEVPDNLWRTCPACGQMIFRRELEMNLWVCPKCDHHLRLSARQRAGLLFDPGGWEAVEPPAVASVRNTYCPAPLKARARFQRPGTCSAPTIVPV